MSYYLSYSEHIEEAFKKSEGRFYNFLVECHKATIKGIPEKFLVVAKEALHQEKDPEHVLWLKNLVANMYFRKPSRKEPVHQSCCSSRYHHL